MICASICLSPVVLRKPTSCEQKRLEAKAFLGNCAVQSETKIFPDSKLPLSFDFARGSTQRRVSSSFPFFSHHYSLWTLLDISNFRELGWRGVGLTASFHRTLSVLSLVTTSRPFFFFNLPATSLFFRPFAFGKHPFPFIESSSQGNEGTEKERGKDEKPYRHIAC